MTLSLKIVFACAAFATAQCLMAQTADPTAAPTANPVRVPAAQPGTFTVQNGELVVAPGLRIPNGNVPWALDTLDGKPVLVPIHHSIAADGTAADDSRTLPGAASHTPLHSPELFFFVHGADRTENTGDSGRGIPTGWALVLTTAHGSDRTFARVRFADVSAGTVCTAPVVCMTADALPGNWLRFAPTKPLAPGEYVLMPIARVVTTPVTIVYDFSVGQTTATPRDAIQSGTARQPKKK